jgi:hypothetical protein
MQFTLTQGRLSDWDAGRIFRRIPVPAELMEVIPGSQRRLSESNHDSEIGYRKWQHETSFHETHFGKGKNTGLI